MHQQARVTVVIPAYKAERTICRAVDSALAQQGVDVGVVVVVDGSFDATEQRLEGYDPGRVKVLVNPRNMGVTVSRNKGLAEADGDYVMFLDSDDFIEGRMLAGLVQAMREGEADLGFGPLQVLKEEAGKRMPPARYRFASSVELFWKWLSHSEAFPPCATLWRTAFVKEIGGWNEGVQRNEDGELVLRAIMLGAKFVQSTEGRGIYVHHDSVDRLTSRTNILQSRLDVAEMILTRDTEVIPEDVKIGAVARYCYRVALSCYSRNVNDIAERALARSRELGFTGHTGPFWHRASAALLGVPLRYRITNFIKKHRVFGFKGL